MVPLVESHFANTPTTNSDGSSPKNGFTSIEGTSLLQEELNQLLLKEIKHQDSELVPSVENNTSIDDLQSPTDENISMFVRLKSDNSKSNKTLDFSVDLEKKNKDERTAEVFKKYVFNLFFGN